MRITMFVILIGVMPYAFSQDIVCGQTCDQIADCNMAQAAMQMCEQYDLDGDDDGQACDEYCNGSGGNGDGDGGSSRPAYTVGDPLWMGGGTSAGGDQIKYPRDLSGTDAVIAKRIEKKIRFRSMDTAEKRKQYGKLMRIYFENGVVPQDDFLRAIRANR